MHRRLSSRQVLASLQQHQGVTQAVSLSCRLSSSTSTSASERSLKDVEAVTSKLIKVAGAEPRGWRHSPSLRGTEKRLKAAIIQTTQQTRPPSMDQTTYNASIDEEEGVWDESGQAIVPGAFVELRRNTITSQGVVVGEAFDSGYLNTLSLTSSGEIWKHREGDIMFVIPSVVPEDLAIRCGIEYLPENQIQVNARVEVLKRIRQIERSVEEAYSVLCEPTIDIYDAVRSGDPANWADVSVPEVARLKTRKFNQIPALLTLFATHKYMMKHPEHFVAQHSYRDSQIFRVRPLEHVQTMMKIAEWSRLRDGGPLQSFGRKIRHVRANMQKIPWSPSDTHPRRSRAEHTWTSEDRTILSFLLHSLRPRRDIQADPYSLGRSAIMKTVDRNGPPVDDAAVQRLLTDVGVLAPWQDLIEISPEVRSTFGTSKNMQEIDERAKISLSKPPTSGPLGPDDFYPSDPLESIRHDFGDMAVYVIDRPDAKELDDGISLERIPSHPDEFWLHVHIADPASVIPPTHFLAERSVKCLESFYFMNVAMPMLPKSLTHSPEYGLSIGSSKEKPTRVLTFSSRLNKDGTLIDYKVQAGLIRNIKILNYETVDNVLGHGVPRYRYPFGGAPRDVADHSLSEQECQELRELSVLTQGQVSRRIALGYFSLSDVAAEVTQKTPIPSSAVSPTLKPSIFVGFPHLRYQAYAQHEIDVGSHAMVSESMKLACRVASRFLLDKGVPALRRIAESLYPAFRDESSIDKVLAGRSANGYVSFLDLTTHIARNPKAGGYSVEPGGHFFLGVEDGEGYVRTTSPLRRYGDLIMHWQIHHALLGTAAPSRSPPFDIDRLRDLAVTLRDRERERQSLVENHVMYWNVMFIKRWQETRTKRNGADDPLEQLQGRVIGAPVWDIVRRSWGARVQVPLLGIHARVINVGEGGYFISPGDTLPIKIHELRLDVRPTVVACTK